MLQDVRFRLLVSFLAVIALTLGLAGAAGFYVTWRQGLSLAREHLAAQAQDLRRLAAEQVTTGDRLQPHPGITVRVLDTAGRPLGAPSHAPTAEEAKQILQASGRDDGLWMASTDQGRTLHLSLKLTSSRGGEGYADCSTPLGSVVEATHSLRTALAIMGAGLTVLAMLLSYYLARRILDPVEEVRSVAARMTAGEFSIRLPESGDDAFGRLRRTINALAGDLERNFNQMLDEKNRLDGILSSLADGVVTVREDGLITFLNYTATRTIIDWRLEQLRARTQAPSSEEEPSALPEPSATAPIAGEVEPQVPAPSPGETTPLVEPEAPPSATQLGGGVTTAEWREVGGTTELLGACRDREQRFLGKNLLTLLDPAPLADLMEHSLTTGNTISREISLGERHFTVFAIPLAGSQEEGTGSPRAGNLLILLRDVTGLRQQETARSQFLGNVSHELRTPLTIIKGFVITLLKSPGMSDEWKRYLEFIDRETDRLARLVDDVLNLARLRSRRTQMNIGFCEPGELLRETWRQLDAQATRYETTLLLDCPSDLPVVPADSDRFKEVVINLVDNAFKHTPPHGTVELSAEASSEHLIIRVRDSGPGIPPEEIPFLFERFFRGTGRSGRKTGGTGIGLAIVKEIVDAHRGRIEVESHPGVGTTFVVRLPLRKGARRP